MSEKIPAQPWQRDTGSHGCLRSVFTGALQGCVGGGGEVSLVPVSSERPCSVPKGTSGLHAEMVTGIPRHTIFNT